ncbi:MAG: DUF5343 domain-containing protein [candidate division Zixibacteria bacterium]|nr:DUF5343 domain-containing protein [candidate division Zixibacteria bacterium]
MAEFPYTPNAASLKRFFVQIQTIGTPSKVTIKWIQSLGFKTSNDRSILSILKSLGFTDNSGTPSEKWQAYRNKKQAGSVLAMALREAYSSLFETYPDANRKDDEALRNFFSSHTTVGDKALSYMVRTFKTLTGIAEFNGAPTLLNLDEEGNDLPKVKSRIKPEYRLDLDTSKDITINVNIQLQLPASDDATIYEKLFEALNKYVLQRRS